MCKKNKQNLLFIKIPKTLEEFYTLLKFSFFIIYVIHKISFSVKIVRITLKIVSLNVFKEYNRLLFFLEKVQGLKKTLLLDKDTKNRNKTLSIEEYLNKIRPYLKNIINDLNKSDTREIQLTIAIILISTKGKGEAQVMH